MKQSKVVFWIVMILLGTVLVILGSTNVMNEFFGYFGSGILGVSLMYLFKYYRMSKNPELQKKIEIESTDERNIMLAYKAGHTTLRLCILTMCVVEVILFTMGYMEAGYALSVVICIELLCYYGLYCYYKFKG